MAYRFDGVDDRVQFAVTSFVGYSAGPITYAVFFKRNGLNAAFNVLIGLERSDGSDSTSLHISSGDIGQVTRSGSTSGAAGPTISTTSSWILLVGTILASGGGNYRLHSHNGTSWVHNAGSASPANVSLLVSDLFHVGSGLNTTTLTPNAPFLGDIACCGIKKSDVTDAAVETLSRTDFSTWLAFGFDWLVQFNGTGARSDLSSSGTGGEISRVGTSLASDPMIGDIAIGTQTTLYEDAAQATATVFTWTAPFYGWYEPENAYAGLSYGQPHADFVGAPLSGGIPLNVAFTDLSTVGSP